MLPFLACYQEMEIDVARGMCSLGNRTFRGISVVYIGESVIIGCMTEMKNKNKLTY